MQTISSRIPYLRTFILACSVAALTLSIAGPAGAYECNDKNTALNAGICLPGDVQDMQIAQRKCAQGDKGYADLRLSCQNANSACVNAIANDIPPEKQGTKEHISRIRDCNAKNNTCYNSLYFNDERCVRRAG